MVEDRIRSELLHESAAWHPSPPPIGTVRQRARHRQQAQVAFVAILVVAVTSAAVLVNDALGRRGPVGVEILSGTPAATTSAGAATVSVTLGSSSQSAEPLFELTGTLDFSTSSAALDYVEFGRGAEEVVDHGRIVLIDAALYKRSTPGTAVLPAGVWVAEPADDFADELFLGLHDPVRAVAIVDALAAAGEVVSVADDEIDDVPVDRVSLRIRQAEIEARRRGVSVERYEEIVRSADERRARLEELGLSRSDLWQDLPRADSLSGQVSVSVSIDEEGRLRALSYELGLAEVALTITAYGDHVAIVAPDAEDVVDADELERQQELHRRSVPPAAGGEAPEGVPPEFPSPFPWPEGAVVTDASVAGNAVTVSYRYSGDDDTAADALASLLWVELTGHGWSLVGRGTSSEVTPDGERHTRSRAAVGSEQWLGMVTLEGMGRVATVTIELERF